MTKNVLECQAMLDVLLRSAKESEDSTLLVGIKKSSFDFVIKKAYELLRKVDRYEDTNK